MKCVVIDSLNRVLTPVLAFLTGMSTTITIHYIATQQPSIAIFAIITSVTTSALTYLSYKFTIRKECDGNVENRENFKNKMHKARREVNLSSEADEYMSNFINQEIILDMLKKIGLVKDDL